MKTFDQDKWKEIREQGHARFLVRRGLLFWGVPFGLFVTLGPYVYDLVMRVPTPTAWGTISSFVLLTLIFGYGMGESEWRRNERAQFNEALQLPPSRE